MTITRVVTVAPAADLALIAALAESLHDHDGGRRLVALVLDLPGPTPLPADLPFDVLGLDELGLADEVWHRAVTWLGPEELALALVPVVIGHLLDDGADVVVHLAGDAQVYGSLDDLIDLARSAGIALTPRARRSPPLDGREPTEQAIFHEGVYDQGVMAVGASARSLVDEWAAHTIGGYAWAAHGARTSDVIVHRVVPFIDLVPAWWSGAAVWSDPGANVAYWNLHERTLAMDADGRVSVDGRGLKVFRWRGFDPDEPHRLTTDTGDRGRVSVLDDATLTALCTDRAVGLSARASLTRHGPYRWARLPNGLEVQALVRDIYGDGLARFVGDEAPMPVDPWAPGGDDELVAWLNEPAAGTTEAAISRYLFGLWSRRIDLRVSFPDPWRADAVRLRHWAATDEAFHRSTPATLWAAAIEAVLPSGQRVAADDLTPGYNVVGYLEAEFGLGDSARLVARSVGHTGIPLATSTVRIWTQARQRETFRDLGSADQPHDINLLVIMPNELLLLSHEPALGSMLEHRYNVGLWFWEVDQLTPRIVEAAALIDEVWVASAFNQRTFSEVLDVPVLTYRHPVPLPPAPTHLTRLDLGLPMDPFIFGFVFDFDSVLDRKNPMGLVQAYTDAFGPDDGAVLVLKSVNGERRRADLDRLRHQANGRSDIVIIDEYWSGIEVQAFFQLIDCFASLHRSEGFGQTLARAMGAAKPVVATGYSGNLDFMNDTNSFLVPYELTEVGPGRVPYPADATWAEPDLQTAAKRLRQVFDDPDAARVVGQRGHNTVQRDYSVAASAPFFAEQFERISRR